MKTIATQAIFAINNAYFSCLYALMNYRFIFLASCTLLLAGCFHARTPEATQQPTSVPTGDAVAQPNPTPETDTGTAVVPAETGMTDTGFKTKDFSDPEVEEVVDLLEGMLKE